MSVLKVTHRLVFVLAFVALVGCGAGGSRKPTAHLQGTVTIGGQPIPSDAQASINFKPTASGQAPSTSAQITNGKFDAPDVPIGDIIVYFNVQQPTGRMVREGTGTPYAEMRSLVPEKHGTGMTLKVAGDNLEQNFDL